jgi:hypothetical protein
MEGFLIVFAGLAALVFVDVLAVVFGTDSRGSGFRR